MKPYTGAPTPEAALEEYVKEPISKWARVSGTDLAYQYFQATKERVVFVRREPDGRRTMSVLVRPSSGGGWQGAEHIACEKSSGRT